MSEPKRYLNWCQATHGHDMLEKSNGPWVLYEEYDRLRYELERLNEWYNALYKEYDRLRYELERLNEWVRWYNALVVTNSAPLPPMWARTLNDERA